MASTAPLQIRMGSYLRYKALTDQCLSWLLDAAIAAGYTIPCVDPLPPKTQEPAATKPNQTLGEKLREKQARKAAKRKGKEKETQSARSNTNNPPTKYITVKTKELVQQANLVAENKTKVPPNIAYALEQAIAARKRAAAWFQSAGSSEVSISGHQHFITLLENIKKILTPDVLPSDILASGAGNETGILLANRFEALAVEDTQDDLDDTVQPSMPLPSDQSEPAPAYDFKYEDTAEDSFNTFDNQFAISCFFEDLHRMQAYVREIWQEYQDGLLDPQVAAFITNAAIELARKEEIDLMERLGPDQVLSQKRLTKALQSRNLVSAKTESTQWQENLMISPFDDFVYNRTYHYLEKYGSAYLAVTKVPYCVPSNKPFSVPQDQQHLLLLPAVQKGDEDDRFLTQLLIDLRLAYQCNDENRESPMKAEMGGVDTQARQMVMDDCDAFTRGFREFLVGHHQRKGTVKKVEASTWLCFAGQLILDIRDALEEEQFKKVHDQFHQKLQFYAGSFTGQENYEWIPAPPTWLQRSPAAVYLMEILGGSYDSVFETFKGMCLEEKDIEKPWNNDTQDSTKIRGMLDISGMTMEDYIKQRDENAIQSSEDTFFLSSMPLGCGLRHLRLDLAVEEGGISHANMDGASFFLAHGYNAARQLGLLQTPWPEMDRFISLQMKSLFSGQLPAEKDEFRSRLSLKIGWRMSNILARRRGEKHVKLAPGHRYGPQLSDNNVSSILRDLYNEGSYMNIHQCLEQLQAIFLPSSTKRGHRQPQLGSLELLQLLKSSLPSALHTAQFDYFKFTRVCEDVLKRMRSTFLRDLGLDYFKLDGYKNRDLEECMEKKIGTYRIIWGTLTEVGDIGAISPQLKIVAEVLDKYIVDLG